MAFCEGIYGAHLRESFFSVLGQLGSALLLGVSRISTCL